MPFRMLRNFDRVFALAYYVSGLTPHEIETLTTFARVPTSRWLTRLTHSLPIRKMAWSICIANFLRRLLTRNGRSTVASYSITKVLRSAFLSLRRRSWTKNIFAFQRSINRERITMENWLHRNVNRNWIVFSMEKLVAGFATGWFATAFQREIG